MRARKQTRCAYSTMSMGEGTNPGSEMLEGTGKRGGFGDLTSMRAQLFFTKYAGWQRPEGSYHLVFEHERLTRITSAPEAAVTEPPTAKADESALPARFVLLLTDNVINKPRDLLDSLIRQGALTITPDALLYSRVDQQAALDWRLDQVLPFALGQAMQAVSKAQKPASFLDLKSPSVRRFRKTRGLSSSEVFVAFSGPRDDPDSWRTVEVKKRGQRDVCGKCGITQEQRLKLWNTPVPSGVVKIGDGRGAFMYCPQCKDGICGACSIDLGMTAGCPNCRTGLNCSTWTEKTVDKARGKIRMARPTVSGGSCGIGFGGGQCLSLADYVMVMGPVDGALAAGGR